MNSLDEPKAPGSSINQGNRFLAVTAILSSLPSSAVLKATDKLQYAVHH